MLCHNFSLLNVLYSFITAGVDCIAGNNFHDNSLILGGDLRMTLNDKEDLYHEEDNAKMLIMCLT